MGVELNTFTGVYCMPIGPARFACASPPPPPLSPPRATRIIHLAVALLISSNRTSKLGVLHLCSQVNSS